MNPVESLFTTYKTALAEKDVDLLIGLFDAEIVMFDVGDQWSLTGLENWRSAVKEWFAFLGTDKLEADFEIKSEAAADDLIAVSAFVTFTAFSSEGAKLRSKRERLTWVVSMKEDGWKIVQCHNSLPLNFQTGQALSD